MSAWFENVLDLVSVILGISVLLAVYRLIKGPTRADRVLALDSIGITMMGITAVLSIRLSTQLFTDIILVLGVLTFLGTVSIAKYLEKGVVFERDPH